MHVCKPHLPVKASHLWLCCISSHFAMMQDQGLPLQSLVMLGAHAVCRAHFGVVKCWMEGMWVKASMWYVQGMNSGRCCMGQVLTQVYVTTVSIRTPSQISCQQCCSCQ
jgi:hypothetical protein